MIITKKDFSIYVEDNYATTDHNMIDTILQACEDYNIDPEMVEPLINRSIKEKVELDFIKLNYLKAKNHTLI